MEFNSFNQEIVTDGCRKRQIFEDIMNLSSSIMIVVPFISGKVAEEFIKRTKNKICLVYHDDIVNNKIISQIPSERRMNLRNSLLYCMHIKIVVVDREFVYIGSSNFVDETFHKVDKGMFCEESLELDIWMHSPSFAEYLIDKYFSFYHMRNVLNNKTIKINGKGYLFNVYTNNITDRLKTLCEHPLLDSIILVGKTFNPESSLLETFRDKKITIYSSFENINYKVSTYYISQLKNYRLFLHKKKKSIMLHQKSYYFVLKNGQVIMLCGSYNLTRRSHLIDSELIIEMKINKEEIPISYEDYEEHNIKYVREPSMIEKMIAYVLF